MGIAWRGLLLTVFLMAAAYGQDSPTNPSAELAPAPIASAPAASASRGDILVVVGAEGASEYGEQFREWAQRWISAAQQGGLTPHVVGLDETDSGPPDLERLRQATQSLAAGQQPLWLVLIGHGSFDGKHAKFNLRGDDLAAEELSEWLRALQRPKCLVASFSASAPFMEAVSAADTVMVSATKNGSEVNFSRFGGYFSQAIGDLQYDLDKDEQVSVLEAFLAASRLTQQFYEAEGRLATEHALLDDNGDQRGTRSEAFEGLRLIEKDSSTAWDGMRAHQWHLIPSADERRLSPELAARRDQLELEILRLRDLKSTLPEEIYYRELEPLLLQMAEIYSTLDQ